MTLPIPGPGRITLALLLIVPAAMAYPWHTSVQRWVLGVAVVVTLLLLASWRGRYLTTIGRRRLALLRRGGGSERLESPDVKTTVALRIAEESDTDLPLDVIGSYLQRYGIRADAVRVTSRDVAGKRTTWVSLTLGAASNLAALQARSASLPLRQTAGIALRRMADHLRELGWLVNTADADVPDLIGPQPKQRWQGVADGTHGYLAAYEVLVGDSLDETLLRVRSLDAPEVWTALEFTGSPDRPRLAVACAVRSAELPVVPLENLRCHDGEHLRALTALHPLSTERLLAQRVPVAAVRT